MASSPSDNLFVFPDPSLLGLRFPPQQDTSIGTALPLRPETPVTPSVATPASPFPLDPALLARPGPIPSQVPAPDPIFAAPAPPPGPFAGPTTAPRLAAAGLQPFPALTRGAQAPIELTNGAQIQKWNLNLHTLFDNSRTGLRNGRIDRNQDSQRSRHSRARQELK